MQGIIEVLVDTSVWSIALRRSNPSENEKKIIDELMYLIRSWRVVVIGAIRQELLSGISDASTFLKLKERFSIFPDHPLQAADYEMAANFSNICRKNGIQGAHTDFLICAVSVKNKWPIFTKDKDFKLYQKYLPIDLYVPEL